MKVTTPIYVLLLITALSGTISAFDKVEYLPEQGSITLFDSLVGTNTVRIMKIQANMVVETADELLLLVDRAKAKGANTVLFGDSKLNRYGIGENPGTRWLTETQKFVEGVKARNMDLLLMTVTMGFCGSVISDNANLTTGYPIKDQTLRVQNGSLRPMSSANLPNGGFENFSGNVPVGWEFQDAPGSRTFVDTTVKRSGNASFRAEARGGQMSRIITSFPVRPFHQYTLRFWIKTENLTAQNLLAVVRDENNKDRNLTNLRMSTPASNGSRQYFNRPNNLTTNGWQEMRIAFNSLEATRVNLGLSVFGGTSGTIWWDDVAIVDSPFLNWLNRDDLPISVKGTSGNPLRFGTDVALPVDPKLGVSGFPGKYDTHHQAPVVSIPQGSSLKEGDLVNVSGYHALPTANGQVSCSWNHPEVYERMRSIHQRLQDTFAPDGFFLNYSEIRTGGWEPLDTQIGTSGEALAASIERAFTDLFEVAPNAQYYFWNDMADPNHNAKPNYYQVNNTLEGSWETLDPNKVVIATWWEGEKIVNRGPNSLAFFQDQGFEQVLGAFYDADVALNFEQWQTAGQGIDGIIGNMYATWRKDYSKIEDFGDLWWVPGEQSQDLEDSISLLAAPDTVVPGGTYTISVAYSASQDRDIIVLFQQDSAPWNGYGWARSEVVKGEGTQGLELTLDAELPVQEDEYKWTVVITPKGGNWSTRLDVERLEDVDCVSTISAVTTDSNAANSELEAAVLAPDNDQLRLFPNPADKQMTLLLPNGHSDVETVLLYDLQGRLTKEIATEDIGADNRLPIATQDLSEGVYLLSIYYGQGDTETIRFLVQH